MPQICKTYRGRALARLRGMASTRFSHLEGAIPSLNDTSLYTDYIHLVPAFLASTEQDERIYSAFYIMPREGGKYCRCLNCGK